MGLFAAIHVGSEQVSVQVVEYQTLHNIKIIDTASRHVMLGEETFKTGRIGYAAVSEICDLLNGYRRILNEYGVRDYRLVATTAIREAENQQYIIDQIQVKTGFLVEVVDMPQEIFYKYVSLSKTVKEHGLLDGPDGVLFVDISSGGLGFTLYKNHTLQYQQNIHIGALRIKESFNKTQRESAHFNQALAEYIYSTIEPVEQELVNHKIKYLVLSGLETRLLLKMLGQEQVGRLSSVSLADFEKLYDQIQTANLPQLMKAFDLTEHKAEIVLPTIVLYKQILSLTEIEEIIIPHDHFMDGITTLHIAEKTKDAWLDTIDKQIVSLARSIGRKYKHDPVHGECVENLSLLLFDRLVRVHGLGKRERLLLKVAAILHDIGKFINLRRHYFYSYRLIISSDILGFSEDEKAVIANIAYYHSKGTPTVADANYGALTKEQRVTTSKLAAIIRLADAIDRSHRTKASVCDISLKTDEIVMTVTAEEDISLEEWTFADKTDFFEDVYGIRAILKRRVR
jgi:exopolyphosphatase/guanosine-5'-triphosphate,3'-diphosphate pyrophosphatase